MYDNESHFSKENLYPKQVLTIFRNRYKTGGLDRIKNLCKKADVPYLYLLPKLKDVNKLRPLASYFRHPLKKVYKFASMGLLQILKSLSNVNHFNLFKTYDTLEKIEEMFKTIEKLESENPDLYIATYAGDVKQLFTELPHDEIIKSIEWAIHMLRKTKIERCKNSVTLNLTDKSGSRIGPNYDDVNTIKYFLKKY